MTVFSIFPMQADYTSLSQIQSEYFFIISMQVAKFNLEKKRFLCFYFHITNKFHLKGFRVLKETFSRNFRSI